MKEDSCVLHFGINSKCNYLSIESNWYNFSERKLTKYQNFVIPITKEKADIFHQTLINNKIFD